MDPIVDDFGIAGVELKGGFDVAMFKKLESLRKQYMFAKKNNVSNQLLFNQFLNAYSIFLADLKSNRPNIEGNSIAEILANERKLTANTSLDKMNKFAQRSLQKMVGKGIHWLASDATSAIRRDILSVSERMSDQIDISLNELEDYLDINSLEKAILYLQKERRGMYKAFLALKKAAKIKSGKPLLNFIDEDVDGTDMSHDERTDLKKKLRTMKVQQRAKEEFLKRNPSSAKKAK
jgi:hypothetical protein